MDTIVASSTCRFKVTSPGAYNQDIQTVLSSEAGRALVRESNIDVICAGFPRQVCSVEKPLSQSQGLAGRKGLLWWSIARLLRQRNDNNRPVRYLMLENVDRLISSPAGSRNRDFVDAQGIGLV